MNATKNLGEQLDAIGEEVAPELERLASKARDLNERVLGFIKERPGTALLGAVAVGFLIGRILRSRS